MVTQKACLLAFRSWVGHLWEGRGEVAPPHVRVRGGRKMLLTAAQIIVTSPSLLIACLACRLLCLPGASHGPELGDLASAWGRRARTEGAYLLPGPDHSQRSTWTLHLVECPAIPGLSFAHLRKLPPGSREMENTCCSWRPCCSIPRSSSVLCTPPAHAGPGEGGLWV